MTPLARFLSALSGPPDELPTGVAYPEIPFRDTWCAAQGVPWWAIEEARSERMNPAARAYLAQVGCDWWSALWTRPRREREAEEYLQEGERSFVLNRVTGERRELFPPWQPRPAEERPEPQPLRPAEWYLEARQPVPAETQIAEGRWDFARATVADLGRDYFLYSYTSVPFPLSFVQGFEQTMLELAGGGEFLHWYAQAVVAEQREYFRAMAAVGIRGVWMQDYYGGAELLSRGHYRDVVLPHGRDLVAEAHGAGLVVIHCFMGNAEDRADLVAAMGADVLLFEEGRKGYRNDLATLAPQVKRPEAVLVGNLSSEETLAAAPEQVLRAEVERLVEVGRRWGRFLFSTGSPPTPGTSLARIRLAADMAKEAWER